MYWCLAVSKSIQAFSRSELDNTPIVGYSIFTCSRYRMEAPSMTQFLDKLDNGVRHLPDLEHDLARVWQVAVTFSAVDVSGGLLLQLLHLGALSLWVWLRTSLPSLYLRLLTYGSMTTMIMTTGGGEAFSFSLRPCSALWLENLGPGCPVEVFPQMWATFGRNVLLSLRRPCFHLVKYSLSRSNRYSAF